MSSAEAKIKDYYDRGGRPLTIEEIERVYAEHPWLQVPKDIYVLDGDVRILHDGQYEGTVVGVTPTGEPLIILTPISNDETVIHETLHTYGLQETPTRFLAQIIARKRFALMPRQVKYDECDCGGACPTALQILSKYNIQPGDTSYPNIKHYYLVEE